MRQKKTLRHKRHMSSLAAKSGSGTMLSRRNYRKTRFPDISQYFIFSCKIFFWHPFLQTCRKMSCLKAVKRSSLEKKCTSILWTLGFIIRSFGKRQIVHETMKTDGACDSQTPKQQIHISWFFFLLPSRTVRPLTYHAILCGFIHTEQQFHRVALEQQVETLELVCSFTAEVARSTTPNFLEHTRTCLPCLVSLNALLSNPTERHVLAEEPF